MPRCQLDMWPRNMDKLFLIIDSLHLLLLQGEASYKYVAKYLFSSLYLFTILGVCPSLKYDLLFLVLEEANLSI